jgi:hypothetical protein
VPVLTRRGREYCIALVRIALAIQELTQGYLHNPGIIRTFERSRSILLCLLLLLLLHKLALDEDLDFFADDQPAVEYRVK